MQIINIKKIVRFMTWNQLYAIFRRAQVKVVSSWKVFSFYAILGLHGALKNVTPSINEKALHCDGSVVNGTVNDAFAFIFCFGRQLGVACCGDMCYINHSGNVY